MSWHKISSHRQRTIMDEWSKYLCMQPSDESDGVWEIGVCGLDDQGDFMPMTDDAVVEIRTISEKSIKGAATSLGWARVEDWPAIANTCRQHLG